MTIIILGRQPHLGLAEIESLYGADTVTPISNGAARVDVAVEEVARQELGGAVKVARTLTELPTIDWSRMVDYSRQYLSQQADALPEGKIKLGLSVYGFNVSRQSMQKTGLNLKKAIIQSGRSIRIIPNNEPALNSATVLHNKLTGELGIELLFIANGDSTIIAQTVRVQNIENYTFRDRGRPKRDAFVGMLPPKLAQTMIHLANPPQDARILDPFCGTGVVLQEAALFGYSVYGSDLSEKMVRYSRDNLNWLKDTHHVDFDWYLEEADAQNHIWRQPVNAVVCETYLGQPLSSLPPREKLEEIVHGCNTIARNFLKNIAGQVEPGSRHCVALPAWRLPQGFRHLPVVDDLEKLGFVRASFTHASNDDLLYHREDQIVARELLVLRKK